MKRSKKLIALAGALVVLVIAYAAASLVGGSGTQGARETAGTFPLCDYATDDLTKLSWTNARGTWNFVRQSSVWVSADDASFPVNQSTLDTLAGRIAGLTATREIDDVSSLSDYGLDAPALTVTAGGADGEITVAMGDPTPFADGYYVSVSGKDAVYTIESALTAAFDKEIGELAAMENLPEAAHVTRIAAGDALDATLDEESGAWRDTRTGEPLDGEAVEALVDAARSLTWQTIVAVSVADDALEAYGLGESAARLALYDGQTQALVLLLGGEDDDGNRYARLPDSRMVYTVYGGDASSLLTAGLDTLFARQPVTLALENVEQAVFAWDGGALTVARAAQENTQTADATAGEAQADAEDETEAEDTFTVDGEIADVGGLWSRLISLVGTARVAETAAGEPVLTISMLDVDGAAHETAVYPRDVETYLVPITRESAMLVPADDVDRIVRELKALHGN